jgi:hypothetical protein
MKPTLTGEPCSPAAGALLELVAAPAEDVAAPAEDDDAPADDDEDEQAPSSSTAAADMPKAKYLLLRLTLMSPIQMLSRRDAAL